MSNKAARKVSGLAAGFKVRNAGTDVTPPDDGCCAGVLVCVGGDDEEGDGAVAGMDRPLIAAGMVAVGKGVDAPGKNDRLLTVMMPCWWSFALST